MKLNFYSLALGAISLISTATSTEVSAQCAPGSSVSILDVNNAEAILSVNGGMWTDQLTFNAGYEVPAGSGRHTFYSGGLWIGGTDINNQLKLAAYTYGNGNDYWPGPLEDGTATTTSGDCVNYDRHWKVTQPEIDNFIATGTSTTNIDEWPAKGNPNLSFSITQDMAPFVDVNNDGFYNPSDGDYPAIKGDQAIWFVYNDKGNLHTESYSDPIGVEVHVMAYGFSTNNIINNTTFYEYKVINRGTQTLFDTYLGFFADPDLGNYEDDFAGCDSTRNLGFVYNGDSLDNDVGGSLGYGTQIPVAGIDMVGLPIHTNGDTIPFSSFISYNRNLGGVDPATTDPANAMDYYNFLSGRWKDGSSITYGGTGHGGSIPANFMYPTNPSDAVGWSECLDQNAPGDRRFVMNFGSFTLEPQNTLNFTLANIFMPSAQGGCPDLSDFYAQDDTVQAFFDGIPTSVGIDEATAYEISLYPNPTEGLLTVETTGGPANITIFNLVGSEVYNSMVTQPKNTLSLGHLPAGVYLIRLESEGVSRTEKLVVR